MLVLTRKPGEGIRIGRGIRVSVIELKGNSVRIGIEASDRIPVHRDEIFQRIEEENRQAVQVSTARDSLEPFLQQVRPGKLGRTAGGTDEAEGEGLRSPRPVSSR